jgi:hypothetical protein
LQRTATYCQWILERPPLLVALPVFAGGLGVIGRSAWLRRPKDTYQ